MPEKPTAEPPEGADKSAPKRVTVVAAVETAVQILTIVGTFTIVKSWADGHAHGQKASWLLFVGALVALGIAAAVALWVRQKVKGMGEDRVWRLLAVALVWALPVIAAASVGLAIFGIMQTGPVKGPVGSPGASKPSGSHSPKPVGVTPSASPAATRSAGAPETLGVLGGPKILSVTFSSDSKLLAAGDASGTVQVWGATSHRLAYHVTDPGSKGVNSVAFGVNNSLLATADGNGHVYLWSGNDLKVPLADPSGSSVTSVAFSSDGMFVAAADTGGNIHVWKLSNDSLVSTMTDPDGGGYSSVAFNLISSRLVGGDSRGNIDFWIPEQPTAPLQDPSGGSVESLTFNPENDYLLAGDNHGMVYEWSYTLNGNTMTPFSLVLSITDQRSKYIDSVAVDPKTYVIAAADTSGSISLGVDKFTQVLIDPASRGVRSIAFSANGDYLAAGDANGCVYLWKAPS